MFNVCLSTLCNQILYNTIQNIVQYNAVTNAGTLSHTALALYIRKWRGRGHILYVPLPAMELFAAARHMAELEHNKALKCLLVLCFTVQPCFVEGTCCEEPSKANKH